MKIPFHKVVHRPSAIRALDDVLQSGWTTTGSVCAELETVIAERLGVDARQVVTTSSCTAALELAFMVLCQRGSFAVVPAMTFAATALAPLHAGGRVLVVDVSDDDLNIEASKLPLSGEGTCVIPVHYAGNPANLSRISQIAHERGWVVIEDAAHAWGATYNGVPVGRCDYGNAVTDAACFSLYATKPLSAGEGGFVVFADVEKAVRARILRQHGMSAVAALTGLGGRYEIVEVGVKANLSDVNAALALDSLKHQYDMEDLTARRAIATAYTRAFSGMDRVLTLLSWGAAHLYPLRVSDPTIRDAFAERLYEAGIQTSLHYRPLGWHGGLRECLTLEATPVADRAGATLISLPIFPAMSQEQVKAVIDAVMVAFREVCSC